MKKGDKRRKRRRKRKKKRRKEKKRLALKGMKLHVKEIKGVDGTQLE